MRNELRFLLFTIASATVLVFAFNAHLEVCKERDQWRKAAQDNLREGSVPKIDIHLDQLRSIEFKLDQLLSRPQSAPQPYYVPLPTIPYTNWYSTNFLLLTNGILPYFQNANPCSK